MEDITISEQIKIDVKAEDRGNRITWEADFRNAPDFNSLWLYCTFDDGLPCQLAVLFPRGKSIFHEYEPEVETYTYWIQAKFDDELKDFTSKKVMIHPLVKRLAVEKLKYMKYQCFFEFQGETRREEADGIFHFIYGFWLNSGTYMSKRSDQRYWIPPHRILYIENISKEETDGQSLPQS